MANDAIVDGICNRINQLGLKKVGERKANKKRSLGSSARFNIPAFAAAIGIDKSKLGSLFRNRGVKKDVGASIVSAILLSYPEVSPDWLLTGQGPETRTHVAAPKAAFAEIPAPVRYVAETNTRIAFTFEEIQRLQPGQITAVLMAVRSGNPNAPPIAELRAEQSGTEG